MQNAINVHVFYKQCEHDIKSSNCFLCDIFTILSAIGREKEINKS